MYFMVPITPLLEPRPLVGMAIGTPIYGIGVVQCIFHTGSNTLTFHTHWYHFPNSHALLLRPQLLLSALVGSTGTFTIGEKFYTISLGDKPSLPISYYSKHIFLLPLPIMILLQLLQLRSIFQFSPMKLKDWLLTKSFFSCGNIFLS